MKNKTIETAVGIFVIIGIICIGYMTIKLGKLEWFSDDYYPVFANFQSASGLKPGAHVEIAGVEIGKVESISLDPVRQVALVKLRIQKGVELAEDVIASIKTAGLIGDKFIKLTPGGSDEIIQPGEQIVETESSLDIEDLISKYVFGKV